MGFRLIIIGENKKMLPANIEFVSDNNKHKIISNARVLCLTPYHNNLKGEIIIEALMAGTPIISIDWGTAPELVLHGLTGYRCRTIDQLEFAINNIDRIRPDTCREWALQNFSPHKIRADYEEYFDMLTNVKFGKGFYQENLNRKELCWLTKTYPNKLIVESGRKIKIAIVTETQHAFGRILNALQKYSKKCIIDGFDWNAQFHNPRFADYDLIYLTVCHVAKVFESYNPHLKDKIIFSGHDNIDFISMKIDNNKNNTGVLTNDKVTNFNIDSQVINWFNNRKLGFSVVSHEMHDRLNHLVKTQIFLTQCGVDDKVFYPMDDGSDVELKPIKILFPYAKSSFLESSNGYDRKRTYLIKRIEQKIKDEDILAEFVFLPRRLPLDEIPDYHRQGDIFLCISHSEGNPLGPFESGATGLTIISTRVGEMPHFIENESLGFLIDNGNDDQIVNDVIDRLKRLDTDRELLKQMKSNMYHHVLNKWTWKHKIDQWDDFFVDCYNKLNGI